MVRIRSLFVLVAATLLLRCAPAPTPAPATLPVDAPVSAAVLLPTPRTWLASDSAAILAAQDAAEPLPVAPAAPDAATLAAWQVPPTRWLALETELVAADWSYPTRAARAYALVAATLNDTLRAVDAAHAAGISASDDAALAAAATQVMTYLHPVLDKRVTDAASQARWVGVWRGTATPAEVRAGSQIGRAVATQIIAWAQHDGADRVVTFDDLPATPGMWQRTPPMLWSALDPGWGQVQPIGLATVQTMQATPPPAWTSAAFVADRTAFVAAQTSLTDAERKIVKQWAGGKGSPTPSGLWIQVAATTVTKHQLDSRSAASVYAAVAVTMHDAMIACWLSKYTYLVERPITWMTTQQQGWSPIIETPPFPSYPSGHATLSGAASGVLGSIFPGDRAMLVTQATEAAHSRILGGLHWPLDSRAGLDQGQRIAGTVVATLALRLTAPAPVAVR